MDWEERESHEDSEASSLGRWSSRATTGTVPKEDVKPRYMSTHALLALQELREHNLLCDAVVRLEDGTSFRVHRAILSSCSSYFKALYTTTIHSAEVRDSLLPDVTSSAMQGVLEYVYLRQLNLTPWNVCQILITADYLCMDGAQKLCCEYISAHLVPENCIGAMIFARSFACTELHAEAFNYILRNFTEVAEKSEEILKLSLEDLCLILCEDLLNVKSESQVWECALRWVDANPDDRRQSLSTLMRSIRLGLLDTQYFLERVKDHEYVVGNYSCRPIIIETLRFLYDLEMITQRETEVSTPLIARPRVPHEILFVMGGWSGGTPTNFMETYDTRADRWITVEETDPSGPRAYHGSAVIGHKIFVIGGFDGVEYFNSCRCYDAVAKTWRESAPMNARRCYVSVAVLEEIIYALGGYDGHHRQSSGEKYDHRLNQWTIIAPMNMQRSDANAATLNGKIYITGGFNGQECMNTAEVYDPVVNQWTLIAPMRSRRSGVSCIAFHGCIYVAGGFNGISRMSSAEKYNPTTNQWLALPEMYNPRSNFAMEVVDDLIFAIGGFNGSSTILLVECFDESLNEWFEAAELNLFRSALSACVVRDLPNLGDYVHPHRDRAVEERRQRLIARERAREEAAAAAAAAFADDEEEEEEARMQDARPDRQDPPQVQVQDVDGDDEEQAQGPQMGLMDRVRDMPIVAVRPDERNGGNDANHDNNENLFGPGVFVAWLAQDGRRIALLGPEEGEVGMVALAVDEEMAGEDADDEREDMM
ncbi:kelch-like protein 10 [Ischnura elegans]|uniref:kelch-like protein 10 n=1 Tax=Ischnura elegans TaxID=197161 RepID=UPI001ED8ABF3|nr:kelch-like protein 10 [Ischnura elegans]